MIIVVMADTPAEIERVKHLFNKQQEPEQEWLNTMQFKFELYKKGYKAGALATQKKIAELYSLEIQKVGNKVMFKNEMHKIPSRL